MKWFCLMIFVIAIGMQSNSVFAQDRMPAMSLEKMTDLQKKYAEEIIKGPRGALYGPFVPLIRSLELMDRVQRVGEYLRYRSAIGTKLSELVILITAREWTQQVEWAIHEPIAIRSGIKAEIVRAISDGHYPTGMNEDEQIVYDFCSELHVNKSVADATYERALKRFGEQGVIDMLGINGYYTFLAMIMNGTRTAVPDGKSAPLKAFLK